LNAILRKTKKKFIVEKKKNSLMSWGREGLGVNWKKGGRRKRKLKHTGWGPAWYKLVSGLTDGEEWG